jgi:hypothetical protein
MKNPNDRLTARETLTHQWFADNILEQRVENIQEILQIESRTTAAASKTLRRMSVRLRARQENKSNNPTPLKNIR